MGFDFLPSCFLWISTTVFVSSFMMYLIIFVFHFLVLGNESFSVIYGTLHCYIHGATGLSFLTTSSGLGSGQNYSDCSMTPKSFSCALYLIVRKREYKQVSHYVNVFKPQGLWSQFLSTLTNKALISNMYWNCESYSCVSSPNAFYLLPSSTASRYTTSLQRSSGNQDTVPFLNLICSLLHVHV